MAQRNSLLQALWRSRASMAALCLCICSLARANVNVEVRGVDEQLRSNVLAYLSFERYKRSDDLSTDTIERLHDRIEREVQSALRPFGYYEPQVHSELMEIKRGDWRVTIEIDPGKPVLMAAVEVKVVGPGANDPLFLRVSADPPLHVGERLNHAIYDGIKSDLQRTAATYGYLDAKLTRSDLVVDPQNHTASAALTLQTGDRYRFGGTVIDQNTVDDKLVRRYIRYEEGDPFDLTQILRTQFALDDAQYFSDLEVLPGEPERNTHVVPVTIHAKPNRRNRYSVGAGYATDTGPRGTLTWEDRRINSRGHRFDVLVEGAQVTKYSVQSHYIIPIGDPAVEKLSFNAVVEQRQLADVETRTLEVGPSVTKVTGAWQQVWFINAVRTTSDSLVEDRTDRLLVPGIDLASVPNGYLGEALFERGLFAELRGSHSSFGSDSDFIQLHVQVERVFNFRPKWHLLLRDELGGTLVSKFSRLPTVMRFFAGGDNSVRGFAYNDLSPVELVCTDPATGRAIASTPNCHSTGVKVGGKDVLTGTVELVRDLPNNFGIATFFDYGNAFDSWSSPQLQYSVGVGFRLRLPVVTLGVDIAQPISRSGASPRLHINFSPKL